ncbi:MAG: hypothetical protein AAGF99_02055 [Bacteroidota bacterium]
MLSLRLSFLSRATAVALLAVGLLGCELAQGTSDAVLVGSDSVAAPARVSDDPLAALAEELNGSAQAEAFYYDLQYAAAGVYGPVLLAHFLPAASAKESNVAEARAVFCADLGDGAEACLRLSEQADELARKHELDLVALGVAPVAADRYARVSEGFDFARRCPPPPEPGATQVAIPTYYPNAYFAVEASMLDRRQNVLALQFAACVDCGGSGSRVDYTARAFEALERPKCPRRGCKCEPPRDNG